MFIQSFNQIVHYTTDATAVQIVTFLAEESSYFIVFESEGVWVSCVLDLLEIMFKSMTCEIISYYPYFLFTSNFF